MTQRTGHVALDAALIVAAVVLPFGIPILAALVAVRKWWTSRHPSASPVLAAVPVAVHGRALRRPR